jgi:hypothetical protein
MKLRPGWLGWGSVAVGLALVVGGGFPEGYLSGVMLEIGAAFLLLLALVWVERRLEQRIEAVREETRASVESLSSEVNEVAERISETAARLDELSRATVDRIAEARAADTEAAQSFRENPDYGTIAHLLTRAYSLNAIAKEVSVVFSGTGLWLTFGPVGQLEGSPLHSIIIVRIHNNSWATSGNISWLSDESPEDFLVRLGEQLQRQNAYPGDSVFQSGASQMLDHLVRTLEIAISARTTGEHRFAPIKEVVNDQWYITERGLESPLGLNVSTYSRSDKGAFDNEKLNAAMTDPRVDNRKLEAAIRRFLAGRVPSIT